jgi:CheY-like chemotaxis protein
MAKTLLLADDSVTIQRVVELTFAHEDVRVVSVNDGQQAVQWIDAERPDIVVADVGVPEIDGYAIVSHVKKSKTLRHIPVLLLAGAFAPVDERKARATGCDGVLVKPFEPQQLVARVKELLFASQRWAPAGRKAAGGADANGKAAAPEPVSVAKPVPAPPPAPINDAPAPALLTPAAEPAAPGGLSSAQSVQVAPDMAAPQPPAVPPVAPERLELPAPVWGTAQAPDRPAAPAVSSAAAARVSLATAFSALLAAEQSSRRAPAPAPPVSDSAIEAAVRKVLTEMTGDAVRQIVLETTERLVREEIEKIKANPE